jgi:hypothetical protein
MGDVISFEDFYVKREMKLLIKRMADIGIELTLENPRIDKGLFKVDFNEEGQNFIITKKLKQENLLYEVTHNGSIV